MVAVSAASQRFCLGPRRWQEFSQNHLDTSNVSKQGRKLLGPGLSFSCVSPVSCQRTGRKSLLIHQPTWKPRLSFLLVWWEEMENLEGQSGVEQGNNYRDWESPNGVFFLFFLFPRDTRRLKLQVREEWKLLGNSLAVHLINPRDMVTIQSNKTHAHVNMGMLNYCQAIY